MKITVLPIDYSPTSNSKFITDIKSWRTIFNVGLKKSKDVMDDLRSGHSVQVEVIHHQISLLKKAGFNIKDIAEFQSGDKAIVKPRPITVRVRKAAVDWYNCAKCGRRIKIGALHAVSYDALHYCLKCCEVLEETP